jgi:chemotaxis methyl-accepting protein methylase
VSPAVESRYLVGPETAANGESRPTEEDRVFNFLLDKIRRNRNVDFSRYRRTALKRRINHRLRLSGCRDYWDYLMLLNRDVTEYDRLMEFFRDTDVFDLLRTAVVPEIINRKKHGRVRKIRAWSCGTAYGQEAYSLAILFCEVLGHRIDDVDVKILATDIDKSALEEAPWGSYNDSALRRISPHLVYKYFTRVGKRYMVNDKPRSLVEFKYHDIASGRSMSGMDLVLCRNLLIYFEKDLQESVLQNLVSALDPGGFLVLGKIETIPIQKPEDLEVVNLRERVYRRSSSRTLAS